MFLEYIYIQYNILYACVSAFSDPIPLETSFSVEEATGSTLIGTIVIFCICFSTLTFIVADVPLYYRHLKLMRHNLFGR